MSNSSGFFSTVQSFYLAFFGRPADPSGLRYWSEQLATVGGDLAGVIHAFSSSDEAATRFGGDTPEMRIAHIYQRLFNRSPEPEGLAYWTGVLQQGQMSMAGVAIAILQGAQGADADLVRVREQVVSEFTAQVEASGSAYAGNAASDAAGLLVRAVTAGTSQQDITSLVQATAALTDIATNNPAVLDALAGGGSLQALLDTTRGNADPATLVQVLSELAQSAAGDPAAPGERCGGLRPRG